MQGLPISTQTFEKLRQQGLVYVDKTHHVHALVSEGTYYFLSRPRRFGKSLLLSTLKAYFEGKRELFEGLYLYDREKEWRKYPVVHLDYSTVKYREGGKVFEASLIEALRAIAAQYGVEAESAILENCFYNLVLALYQKHGPVVVLVDEYDKAMMDVLAEPEKFHENRDILRGLYGTLKGLDPYVRFVFLTGVSQFAKVNVFSGLNNLQDISLVKRFSTITGFSQEELMQYFPKHLEAVRQVYDLTQEAFLQRVQHWYNGFSWDGQNFLYNPYSILKFLSDKAFGNYWFTSGTPNFLVEQVMMRKNLPEDFENTKASDLSGAIENPKDLPLIPLLFQTGYLTIKQVYYDDVATRYVLDYPNEEVRQSFTSHLLAAFLKKPEPALQPDTIALREALLTGNTDEFITRLEAFLADIPARLHIKREAYYHSLVYMLLRLIGTKPILEKETDQGRIDAVLELSSRTYVIEFKFAQSKRLKNASTLAAQALKQIEDNGYHRPYLAQGKPVVLMGIGFLDKKIAGKVKVMA